MLIAAVLMRLKKDVDTIIGLSTKGRRGCIMSEASDKSFKEAEKWGTSVSMANSSVLTDEELLEKIEEASRKYLEEVNKK